PHDEHGDEGTHGRAGNPPGEARSPPARASRRSCDAGAALVAKACVLGKLGTARMTLHRRGNLTGRIPAGSVEFSAMGLSFPGQERARQMGELRRGNQHWNVLLETEPDAALGTVRGRIHFVSMDRHRVTSWIFMEWQEREVQERF